MADIDNVVKKHGSKTGINQEREKDGNKLNEYQWESENFSPLSRLPRKAF